MQALQLDESTALVALSVVGQWPAASADQDLLQAVSACQQAACSSASPADGADPLAALPCLTMMLEAQLLLGPHTQQQQEQVRQHSLAAALTSLLCTSNLARCRWWSCGPARAECWNVLRPSQQTTPQQLGSWQPLRSGWLRVWHRSTLTRPGLPPAS